MPHTFLISKQGIYLMGSLIPQLESCYTDTLIGRVGLNEKSGFGLGYGYRYDSA
jgi:hypothetical protein